MIERRLDDAAYVEEQYRDSSNLGARIALHVRFSTNPYDFMRWLFDRYDFPADARILEVGCGTGSLWRKNVDRIPAGCQITLTDRSSGMLDTTREHLRDVSHDFEFREADVQDLSFADDSFDGVIANAMLYHVPDRGRALAEIRRVLRDGGSLHAATFGARHMAELRALLEPMWAARLPVAEFSLETGAEQLRHYFGHVELQRYDDGLAITEVEPIIAYFMSNRAREGLDDEKLAALRRELESRLAHGPIRVSKDAGVFIAW